MDLNDVRVFAKVAEVGSFTGAAKVLGLPKSTVSRKVSGLEDALGVLLLQRSTRRLKLTQSGQVYFARIAHLVSELDEAGDAVQQLQAEPRGLLKLTAPGDLSGLLGALVAAFQDRYPQVEVSVYSTGRRVDLVGEGYDVALRAGVLDDSSLVSRRLVSTRALLCASPDYVERRSMPAQPEQLAEHDCLVFGTDRPNATWRLSGPKGNESVSVSGPIAANDFSVLTALTLAGRGIGLIPAIAVDVEVSLGKLVRVLPSHFGPESGIYAVYPSRRHLSPKVRAFVDFCSDYVASFVAAQKADSPPIS